MPLVINGKKVEVPGVESTCFLDNSKYGFINKDDFGFRSGPVQSVCIHTRMGKSPQPLVHDTKGKNWDLIGVKNANADDRSASWHISIDSDGSFVCHLDLVKHKAYHASQCNEYSVGIEMYQDSEGVITYETLDTCVKVLDVITRELGIQRQIPQETKILSRFARSNPGRKKSQRLAYMKGGLNGKDYYGIFGHRNATRNRGPGDPGDHVFQKLREAGYEAFSLSLGEDKKVWRERQTHLGIAADGMSGPATLAKLKETGHKHGLWVSRPGD